ncbi:hydroxymethylglutaryl-CoA lyase [Flavihumibacter petaseus]|uniref:Hydroxymethylglutaryl-CoA lyase n=1 Tax=Flavihumibacter petaseus NBRC 106054 TaxID=1220578 RepID=A0A0E9N566_9BACT|nr:hydroxymethylglutaryl-CoA lyase [Flavihumibacter petaseus]GAO44485.1 hydroxymethylglutaryl-CoA lyase [Flavihumibacter petaseus NBRC 106054]
MPGKITGRQEFTLVECPRDAMQGWPVFIPTEKKIRYINALLKVGFDTIDFGSFVSEKAIPQMADTAKVLSGLDTAATRSALLAIVANLRGAETAAAYEVIRYIGFPFSVSPTFQQRNANSTPDAARQTVEKIQELCLRRNKELVVYLSMGFGNPYGDPWSEEIVMEWAQQLAAMGIGILSLADTVGLASAIQVKSLTSRLIASLPEKTIGVHLHAHPGNWMDKLDAAVDAGCRRFDGALKGIGGCPMAGDDLVGNMDTVNIISRLTEKTGFSGINQSALEEALSLAAVTFVHDH